MNNPKITNHSFFIQGVISVEFSPFFDLRGMNFEGLNLNVIYLPQELNCLFKVDSYSISRKNVVRGFHGDSQNYKLVSCLFGEIQLVLIDKRKRSPTENNVLYFNTLSQDKPTSVLIPPGVVNAHLCLSENCVFYYKLEHNYIQPGQQIHVKWNDPKYNVAWLGEPKSFILSERDKE